MIVMILPWNHSAKEFFNGLAPDSFAYLGCDPFKPGRNMNVAPR
jgi:hypothetical protein